MLGKDKLQQIIEGALLAAGKPITEIQLLELFEEQDRPTVVELRNILKEITQSCDNRGFTLVHIASGYQFQVKQEFAKWIAKLWEEKPTRHSRAFFETLAIIAYKQPVTRGEIEAIRGVSISTSTFKTLDERNWIRVVGHKNVPGKPALYATTKQFLDYFGLRSLDKLPSLPEIIKLGEDKNLDLDLELNVTKENISEEQEVEAEEICL